MSYNRFKELSGTSNKKPYQPKVRAQDDDGPVSEFKQLQQKLQQRKSKWTVLDSKKDALKKLADEEKERLRRIEELKNSMQHVDTKEMEFGYDEETLAALREKRRLEEEERLRQIQEEEKHQEDRKE